MREVRAVALAALALLGAVAVAAPVAVAGPTVDTGAGASSSQGGVAGETQTANNSTSMGSEVSTFMQSTAGETSESVEAGMWDAAYENSSDRRRVVERRTASIDERLLELQERKQRTIRAYRNGSINRTEYLARMSRIVGELSALHESIEQTRQQANETGANMTAVEQLRTLTGTISGPELAAVARTIAGRSSIGGPNGVDLPDDASGPDRNETDGGPPDDPGQGNGNGQDDGSGQGGGQNSLATHGQFSVGFAARGPA